MRFFLLLALLVLAGCASEPPSVAVGDTITSEFAASDPSLEDGSRYHLYRLQTTAGEILTVTQRSEDVDSYLIISHDADFAVSDFHNDDFELISHDAQISFIGDGRPYYILTNTYDGNDFGPYSLSVTNTPDLVTIHQNNATSITTRLTSEVLALEDGSYYHCYALDTESGVEYNVSMSYDDFEPYLMVASGEFCGETILYTTDDSLSITFTADEGRYYAITNSVQPAAEGRYTLTIDHP